MDLIQSGKIKLHSGSHSDWKIDCDALGPGDLDTLARMVANRFKFHNTVGIPEGGLRFAQALRYYCVRRDEQADTAMLVVDDVMTTGNSMIQAMSAYGDSIGVVIFSRRRFGLIDVYPIFQLNPKFDSEEWS
jgi:orotate phosphoribosyltransferase